MMATGRGTVAGRSRVKPRINRSLARWPILIAAVLAMAGCTAGGPPLPLAHDVDLSRYAGRWYIISEIPYFAERGKIDSSFDVSFPDGRVHDLYEGYKPGAAKPFKFLMTGYVVPNTGNARWEESPIWPLHFAYLILYVDPDYRTALVGYPGRGYGWVLSRSRTMDDQTYQSLLARLGADGYDTAKFRRVTQQ
jgi:apolipoprotein D and lipocalin family protein